MDETLIDTIRALDPEAADLVAAIDLLARVEAAASFARARLVRRAGKDKAHLMAGFKRVADWAAWRAGTSVGQARSDLELVDQLDALPTTAEQVAGGRLSMAKAREVAAGATADPASEQRLLARAAASTWHGTREAAQQVEAGASSNGGEDRLAAHKAATRLRHWVGRDGMGHVSIQWAADDHTGFLQSLAGQRAPVFVDARAAGEEVPLPQLDARALVRMAGVAAASESAPVKARHQIMVTVDLSAWARGQSDPTEVCKVGSQTVPVSLVKALAHESQLAVAFWDGVDVASIHRVGRYVDPWADDAVAARDGRRCVVESCRLPVWTEKDHHEEVHDAGETSYINLRTLCRWHHKLKTLGFASIERDPISRRWILTVLHTPAVSMAA